MSAGLHPYLLSGRIDTPAQCGADISFASVFPHEREYVFPPCTYLESRSEHDETTRATGEEVTFRVVEVSPSVPV